MKNLNSQEILEEEIQIDENILQEIVGKTVELVRENEKISKFEPTQMMEKIMKLIEGEVKC